MELSESREHSINIYEVRLQHVGSMLYKPKKRKIASPEDVLEITKQILKGTDREYFLVLMINTHKQIVAINTTHIGTSIRIHPCEILKPAILANAAQIIVCHNHPSGVLLPSKEDKKVTFLIKLAAEAVDIPLLDHIIVNETHYYSFKEHGHL